MSILNIRKLFNKAGLVKKYNSVYKYIYYENAQFVCHYCGVSADTVDHVPPLSCYEDAKIYSNIDFVKIPCCRECNSLAGNKFHLNIFERNEFLFNRYKKRYKKLLNMPTWDKKDLKELGSSLRKKIKNDLNRKNIIEERINFIKNNLTEAFAL
jgi:NMD protein affecting ribosome stability and mRNA decay|tara:strand:- start:28 stop:489 length:462 start_codon:yes stop_codon:yes gene_type:complete